MPNEPRMGTLAKEKGKGVYLSCAPRLRTIDPPRLVTWHIAPPEHLYRQYTITELGTFHAVGYEIQCQDCPTLWLLNSAPSLLLFEIMDEA